MIGQILRFIPEYWNNRTQHNVKNFLLILSPLGNRPKIDQFNNFLY
jgi:hypothetical protein